MSSAAITYLNTAAAGLVSHEAIVAAEAFNTALTQNPSSRSEYWRFTEWAQTREVLAAFMDAPLNNVAFVPNFSYALTTIVHSLQGTERVLLYKHDYPSLLDAFRINEFDITWVDTADGFTVSLEEIKDLCIAKQIEVVCISEVQWTSGYRLDMKVLARFCKEHGIILIADATQSLGAISLSVKDLDADVVIASNYKWMNAGFGSGVMYMSDAFLKRYPAKIKGMGSYTFHPDGPPTYEPSIRNYEPGHLSMANIIMLEVAMKQKMAMGLNHIEAHNRKLTAQLLDGIKDLPLTLVGDGSTKHRSGIVVLKDENGLGNFLEQEKIIVTHRGGFLRFGLHYYNTEEQVVYAINRLQAFVKAQNTL